MRWLPRFTFAVALVATGCTSILGDIDFDGTGGSSSTSSSSAGGATSSSSSSAGGGGATSSSSSSAGGGGATSSSSSGTGGSTTCADQPCDPIAACDDSTGTVVCTCPTGYNDVNGDGTSCVDWNECVGENGGNTCGALSTCTNTPGGYTCPCNAGAYEYPAGSGVCVDDPCLPDPCSGHGTCDNATGAAVCTCNPSWTGPTCNSCVNFVDAAAVGANDGSSWANAFTTVQAGLAAAKASVTAGAPTCDVWVKAGTYYARVNSAYDAFSVGKNVGLYGGFAGDETDRSEADPDANVTILSGRTSANDASSSLHVVLVANVTGVVIDGFTIRDGNANGTVSPEDADGGGVLFYAYNAKAAGTVSRCEITANAADYSGGGIGTVWDPGDIVVADCDIHDNTSKNIGGGALFQNAATTITGTTFRANTAFSGAGLFSDTVLLMSDSTFANNIASSDGGGLFLRTYAGVALTNVIFRENYAGSSGGAFRSGYPDSATFTSCLFVGNQSNFGGAIYDDTNDGLYFVNSTITGNRGTTNGDGLYWNKAPPTLLNTIVWGNPSVASAASDKDVAPATWASIATSHSDIHGYGGSDATTFDANPLFASVPAFFDRVTVKGASTTSISVALGSSHKVGDVVEIGADGVARTLTLVVANTLTFSPSLAAAAPAGTIVRNWGVSLKTLDLNLSAGSQCIDAADPASAPATDIEGLARNGTADIGAYEYP